MPTTRQHKPPKIPAPFEAGASSLRGRVEAHGKKPEVRRTVSRGHRWLVGSTLPLTDSEMLGRKLVHAKAEGSTYNDEPLVSVSKTKSNNRLFTSRLPVYVS